MNAQTRQRILFGVMIGVSMAIGFTVFRAMGF
jgi:hypothetical protein